MTVKELIIKLQSLPQNATVTLCVNEHSALANDVRDISAETEKETVMLFGDMQE